MKWQRVLAAALAIAGCASIAQAQLLYEQTFNPPNDPNGYGGAIEDSGWLVDYHPGNGFGTGYAGTYAGSFAATGLVNAGNGNPINGNTGVYIGIGNDPGEPDVVQNRGAFYVTEGLGGFEPIDPASCERLLLSIYANLQGTGADDYGYFAVQMGDFDPRTDDGAWYIASSPMAAPTTSAEFFNLRTLVFDPSPGNWNELSLGPVTIGGPAGDLSGLQITGVGIVQENTSPGSTANYENSADAYSSWNYSDYRITCVPEPSALVLLSLAGLALAAGRRTT